MNVKKLNFIEKVETTIVANTSFGNFKITKNEHNNKYIVWFNGGPIHNIFGEAEFSFLEEAMSIAQNCFERSVNECIEE